MESNKGNGKSIYDCEDESGTTENLLSENGKKLMNVKINLQIEINIRLFVSNLLHIMTLQVTTEQIKNLLIDPMESWYFGKVYLYRLL